jgi:chorismate-pyruvate lyase
MQFTVSALLRRVLQGFAIGALLSLAAACANAPRPSPTPTRDVPGAVPDAFVARVEALALLQTLNADLLSHDSATQTLERWCGDHRLAAPAKIVAERVQGIEQAPTSEQRADLKVDPSEQVRYRRVRLRCGALVVSEADNWYVPSRLTPQMNDLLESTDTPFGKVVLPLHFQRHTLSATLLWLPLPKGWEMGGPAGGRGAGAGPAGERAAGGQIASGDATPLRVPDKVLEHRAVLVLPDGKPISEVVETYTGSVLAFLGVNP